MKLLKAALLLSLLCSSLAFAAPGAQSPGYYLGHFAAGEKVLWLGEVVDVNAYQEQDEVVIEWLCKYLEPAEPLEMDAFSARFSHTRKKVALKVKKTSEQYFVSMLRLRGVPLAGAREDAQRMLKSRHFALREGETDVIGEFKGRTVVYVYGGRGTVADNVKLIYVK